MALHFESGVTVGAYAPLSDEGYEMVVYKGTSEMAAFITRIIHSLGGRVTNLGSLSGFAPFYSGEKSKQDLAHLYTELLDISGRPDRWLELPAVTGASAPLNEAGYRALVHKGTPEMATFIRRVVESHGSHVSNEGGLNGFAPFYSGEKSVQCFPRLVEELGAISQLSDGWLRPLSAGAHAPLNEAGYKSVVHKGSDEMTIFIRRVIEAMHVHVTNEGSLAGFVPFYSGEKIPGGQSFDRLLQELRDIAHLPDGWLKY